MAATTTLADVARVAGVSTATVSRFLSRATTVAPETATRVRKAMDELNYKPNRLARALRTNRTGQLGVVLPGFENQFFFELLLNIEKAARKRGFGVLIVGSNTLPDTLAELSRSQAVDGILLASSSWPKAEPPSASIPMVCIDRPLPGARSSFVSVDNVNGAKAVTEHLLAQGAKTFGLLTGPMHIPSAQERTKGFYEAIRNTATCIKEEEGDFTAQAGVDFVDSFNGQTEGLPEGLPDAIFAENDLMAAGVLSRLTETNQKALVAGFDGLTSTTRLYPRITTLVQPQEQLAQLAVDKLIAAVNGETETEQVYLPGKLLVGDTTIKGIVK
ncbi:LacI family DNA-binding transcriptional regulator [Corynebacterium glucuronolyticum]